jgi:hypothetical protein
VWSKTLEAALNLLDEDAEGADQVLLPMTIGGNDLPVDLGTLQEAMGGNPTVGSAQAELPPTALAMRIGGKGWIEIKRFGKNKQRAYRYIRWRDPRPIGSRAGGKVKHSLYDGKAF